MKRWIIFLHRYLGIPMSIVFVIWFVSGIFMIYAGDMPALTEAERLSGNQPLVLTEVRLSPQEAAQRASIQGDVTSVTLGRILGRPAYRIGRVFGREVTVFADNGELFDQADAAEALAAVAAFVDQPPGRVRFVETLTQADQWTITESRQLPLDRFDIDDDERTRVYFSRQSGEVELMTDRRERTLAWVGTIPHWFYFTSLRTNQALWYRTVVWLSILGCVLAVLGLILAVTQFRRSKPFRLSASVRYRGWMRWHYYTGALFGVFALTWVFSGLLSMEPFGWTNATGMTIPRNDLYGGALELDRYRLNDPVVRRAIDRGAIEVELLRIQTEPYYRVASIDSGQTVSHQLIDAVTLEARSEPFPAESVLSELRATVTEASIREYAVLDDYDAYYYSRDYEAPLPALRVKFDDPDDTWAYFDLTASRQIGTNHRLSRLERWLFNGLHSLDFSFWYYRRPLWDIGLIVLSLGALATSSIGMYLGFKRLFGRAAAKSSQI
jgi:uncharacterized iron-regulated membrane protein